MIQPLADRILVKQEASKEEVSKDSGIIVNAKKVKHNKGVVLAIGREVQEIKKGNHIVFGEYAGSYVPDSEGNELLILNESEVLAVEN